MIVGQQKRERYDLETCLETRSCHLRNYRWLVVEIGEDKRN